MIAIGKHVLIKPDEAPVQSGRIIIPELARKRPPSGEVVAVGDDIEEGLKPGDRVAYETGAGILMENGLLGIEEDKILYIK